MFNVLKFELKNNYKSSLIWLIALFLICVIYIAMYPIIETSLQEFESILSNYPKEVLSVLGMNVDLMTSFSGYYIFVITIINIVVFAYAQALTLKVFIKEYKHKSIEFIFTKPIKRYLVVIQKTIAIIILLTSTFVIYFNAIYLTARSFTSINFVEFLKINFPTYILMIYSMIIAIFIQAIFRKIRNSGSMAFITAFVFYFIFVVATLVESEKMLYLSVYGLFDYYEIFSNICNPTPLIVSLIVIIVIYISSATIISRRDVL